MIKQILLQSLLSISITAAAQQANINEYRRINLNGAEHGVFIKGLDTLNAILLVLHGGPGFSDYYFWQTHNKQLEQSYTVVTYDQRGTGLSYNDSIASANLTFTQLENDALALIRILTARFKKEKVYLIGYSAGSIIGINLIRNHPSFFKAYIGVGQVTSGYANERVSLQYSISKARATKDTLALNELLELSKRYPALTKKNDLSDLYLSRKWLRRFNGDFCVGTNVSQLYKNMDIMAKGYYSDSLIAKGQSFSMIAMWDEVMRVDLFKTVTEVKVPVYFIAGRCDYSVPSTLTYKYYKKLKAPLKKFIWFENSGHYAPFIEPDKFNAILVDEILTKYK